MNQFLKNVPAISVIIPTRDRASIVGRAVASVLANSSDNVEVVVSDDGSTDNTAERLRSTGDPRLTLVIAEKSEGANRARNRGAEVSAAPIIAFLDSDDAFLPGRTDRLIAFFEAHPEIDCTIDGYVDHARNRTMTHALPKTAPDPVALRHMLIAHQIPLTNSTITIRRTAFEAICGYDESLKRHQDRDLLCRLLPRYRIAFGDTIDVHKFRSAESISHDFDGYVDGLDAFAARLSEISDPDYENLFRYLVVRGILKALLQGHLAAALREVRRGGKVKHLPTGLVRSLLHYRAGRRVRASGAGAPASARPMG
jgi:glycosyltransferase involved in cell wall biosynthesis